MSTLDAEVFQELFCNTPQWQYTVWSFSDLRAGDLIYYQPNKLIWMGVFLSIQFRPPRENPLLKILWLWRFDESGRTPPAFINELREDTISRWSLDNGFLSREKTLV